MSLEEYYKKNVMTPERPRPCIRALYDHLRETIHNPEGVGKLKEDHNGILRCQGYLDHQGNEIETCCKCPFYLDLFSGFWAMRKHN